jgi:hypothetical protein
MKSRICLLGVLALALSLCLACDQADEQSENGSTEVNANASIVDYSSDITECDPTENTTVVQLPPGERENIKGFSFTLNGESLDNIFLRVIQLGKFSYRFDFVRSADYKILSYTVKQTGADDFSLCDVDFKGMKLKSGQVLLGIYRGLVVASAPWAPGKSKAETYEFLMDNSAQFYFEFINDGVVSIAATEAMSDMMFVPNEDILRLLSKAGDVITLEGLFFTIFAEKEI